MMVGSRHFERREAGQGSTPMAIFWQDPAFGRGSVQLPPVNAVSVDRHPGVTISYGLPIILRDAIS